MRLIRFVKALKDVRQVGLFDMAAVTHLDHKLLLVRRTGEKHLSIVAGILDRIIHKRDQNLLDSIAVGKASREGRVFLILQIDIAVGCGDAHSFRHLTEQLVHIKRLPHQSDAAGLQARKLQQIVDQAGEPHGLPQDIAIVAGFVLL